MHNQKCDFFFFSREMPCAFLIIKEFEHKKNQQIYMNYRNKIIKIIQKISYNKKKIGTVGLHKRVLYSF